MARVREIGGYLELERFDGKPYHADAVALNCGRGCFAYLIELRDIRRVWLPDFMCGSVPELFRREGVEVVTYRIGADLLPVYDFDIADGDWMLQCDYFGQLRIEDVERAYAACDGHLIVDETQGFFRKPWDGVDTVYTCRKWFGVADGGYLYTGDGALLRRELPRDESYVRMGYLLGRYERTASEFFAESKANNELFADEPVKAMSPITENILNAVDYEAVCERRCANWTALNAALSNANLLNLHAPEGPFMYPLMLEGAISEKVRAKLIANKVYIPTLWPNVLDECEPDTWAWKFAHDIVPLPVDQRYGAEEMGRVTGLTAGCLSRLSSWE